MNLNKVLFLLSVTLLFALASCGSEGTPEKSPTAKTTTTAPAAPAALSSLKKAAGGTDFSIDKLNGRKVTGQHMDFKHREILVEGWAIDKAAKQPAGGVYVVVDGTTFPAKYGLNRPDVAKTFGSQALLKTGYSAKIKLADFSKGKHRLGLKIVNSNGTEYYDIPLERFVSIGLE